MARQPAADDPGDAEREALRARVAALEAELRESEERFRSLLGTDALKQAEEQRRLLVEGEKMRALGEMASGVAHDLNQYLGLVAGHGELALHELERPRLDRDNLRDSLRTVVQAAMDGANTVKRLQTFARPRQEGPPGRSTRASYCGRWPSLPRPAGATRRRHRASPSRSKSRRWGTRWSRGGPRACARR